MFKPYAVTALGPLLMSMGANPEYVDLFILVIVMALSFLFWRGGREADYGKLFSLNMLMFFPAVLDFSMFNWVNLILPYEAETKVSPMWVFGVGLLLQTTYLTLRYTAIFKEVRDELKGRGAEDSDLDKVSRGQMGYLVVLVLATAVISTAVYYAFPFVRELLFRELTGFPYPHIIVGVLGTFLIAGATILYLRGGREITIPTSAPRPQEGSD
jgi:magnesium-transporting ATPase (P-type)